MLISYILKNAWLITLLSWCRCLTQTLPANALLTPVISPGSKESLVVVPDQITALREQLKIAPHRCVFLLFDSLNGRQGIDQLLEAVEQLPSILSQQTCLLLVGNTWSTDHEGKISRIQQQIHTLVQDHAVQIIHRDQFVCAKEVKLYFHLADVIIAPYPRHLGMSSVLLLAAATGKPVLSANYGLIGEIVHSYQLGLTVDATSPQAICQGLTRFLTQSPQNFCHPALMRSFATQNSAEQFADIIFSHLKISGQAHSSTHR